MMYAAFALFGVAVVALAVVALSGLGAALEWARALNGFQLRVAVAVALVAFVAAVVCADAGTD